MIAHLSAHILLSFFLSLHIPFIGASSTNHQRTFISDRLKNEKRQSVPQPLKPHNQQHRKQQQPPPNYQHSVQTNINASHLLHARHRSSNYRDCSLSPCSSDAIMSQSLNASSGSLSSVSLSDRSESTDCIEYITDVPFAGKFPFRVHLSSFIHRLLLLAVLNWRPERNASVFFFFHEDSSCFPRIHFNQPAISRLSAIDISFAVVEAI